jgi:hypothetical protein
MNERAEQIINDYVNSKEEAILAEFESLKPRPFAGLISLLFFMVIIFIYSYFSKVAVFEGDYYWLLIAVVIASSGIERESKKINRRIDLLAKLLNAKQNKFENT